MGMNKSIYTSRLLKGGALLEDMRKLIISFNGEDVNRSGLGHLLEALLGKKTRKRAKDVYRQIFVSRFLKGDPKDAWRIVKPLEAKGFGKEVIYPVYYWITARSEPVIYDFVVDRLFFMKIGQVILINDVEKWLRNRLRSQGISWSDSVILRVAQGMLATLRDFGILEGRVKKRLTPYYISVEAFSYIAFCLYRLGNTGAHLIKHRDWGLFLLDPQGIEKLFLTAHQMKYLSFDVAGSIYRIEFIAKNCEEMANVIYGRGYKGS